MEIDKRHPDGTRRRTHPVPISMQQHTHTLVLCRSSNKSFLKIHTRVVLWCFLLLAVTGQYFLARFFFSCELVTTMLAGRQMLRERLERQTQLILHSPEEIAEIGNYFLTCGCYDMTAPSRCSESRD